MELLDYMAKASLTYKEAANQLKNHPENEHGLTVNEKHLQAVATKLTKAGPKLVFLIEKWTERKVTRGDMRPDLWPKVSKTR
jgi:hypothetical protein